jgi:hypothetical protein
MMLSIVHAVALALAWGWACGLLYVSLAMSDGWASRAALGKGAVLALLGMALALPFGVGADVLTRTATSPLAAAACKAFLAAGLPEEGGRAVALILLVRSMSTRDPREYFAGVVAAALSFGVVENLLYLQMSKSPIILGGVRGILSAPAHLSFALFTGLGVWRYARERGTASFAAVMLAVAIVAHGAFDFSIMAWPRPDRWATSELTAPVLIGLGALNVIAVVGQSLGAIAVSDAFLWRIEAAKPHDPALAARAPLSRGWTWLGFVMLVLGPICMLGALVAAAIDRTDTVPLLPLALSASASLGIWGLGIVHLAKRQREISQEQWRLLAERSRETVITYPDWVSLSPASH